MCVLICLLAWLLAFAAGSAAASALYRSSGGKLAAAVAAQVAYALASTVLMALTGVEWPNVGLRATALSLAISLPLALFLAWVSLRLAGDRGLEPPIPLDDPLKAAFVGCALAPLGEELLFRGLLGGCLARCAGFPTAVLLPALLFSLVHIAAFAGAPRRQVALVVANAFALGVVAGYASLSSAAILPAVVAHAAFNAAGIAVWRATRASSSASP